MGVKQHHPRLPMLQLRMRGVPFIMVSSLLVSFTISKHYLIETRDNQDLSASDDSGHLTPVNDKLLGEDYKIKQEEPDVESVLEEMLTNCWVKTIRLSKT